MLSHLASGELLLASSEVRDVLLLAGLFVLFICVLIIKHLAIDSMGITIEFSLFLFLYVAVVLSCGVFLFFCKYEENFQTI